jgi:hypothetical protein
VSSVGCRNQEAPVRIATVLKACFVCFNSTANVLLKIAVFCVVTPCGLLARTASGRNLLFYIHHENGGSRYLQNVDNYRLYGATSQKTLIFIVITPNAIKYRLCRFYTWYVDVVKPRKHTAGHTPLVFVCSKEQPPAVCVSSLYLCPTSRNAHGYWRYELRLYRVAHCMCNVFPPVLSDLCATLCSVAWSDDCDSLIRNGVETVAVAYCTDVSRLLSAGTADP